MPLEPDKIKRCNLIIVTATVLRVGGTVAGSDCEL